MNEEIEAQRDQVTCPKSHTNKKEANTGDHHGSKVEKVKGRATGAEVFVYR